ncbi:hypothetical protein A2U01_0063236, partial [Trifolium medium]|nr:hypothetical protein [Trifolium medium]
SCEELEDEALVSALIDPDTKQDSTSQQAQAGQDLTDNIMDLQNRELSRTTQFDTVFIFSH